MVLLVTGTRHCNDFELFIKALRKKCGFYFGDLDQLASKITLVVHGGCRGIDTLAGKFAESYNIPVRLFSAEWKKYGVSAGPIRNKEMLDWCVKYHLEDLFILAMPTKESGQPNYGEHSGTRDMMSLLDKYRMDYHTFVIQAKADDIPQLINDKKDEAKKLDIVERYDVEFVDPNTSKKKLKRRRRESIMKTKKFEEKPKSKGKRDLNSGKDKRNLIND